MVLLPFRSDAVARKLPVLRTENPVVPTLFGGFGAGILPSRSDRTIDRNTHHTGATTMQRILSFLLTAALASLAGACTDGFAATTTQDGPPIKWGPAPAVFAAGAQFAVLQGDPSKDGVYTVRLKLPNGYRIAPHTHPTDENVTVIEGAFLVGMGEKFDTKVLQELKAGGFVTAPAGVGHFAPARGGALVQGARGGPVPPTDVDPPAMAQSTPGR